MTLGLKGPFSSSNQPNSTTHDLESGLPNKYGFDFCCAKSRLCRSVKSNHVVLLWPSSSPRHCRTFLPSRRVCPRQRLATTPGRSPPAYPNCHSALWSPGLSVDQITDLWSSGVVIRSTTETLEAKEGRICRHSSVHPPRRRKKREKTTENPQDQPLAQARPLFRFAFSVHQPFCSIYPSVTSDPNRLRHPRALYWSTQPAQDLPPTRTRSYHNRTPCPSLFLPA